MEKIECSFCGKPASHDEAKGRFIAGPKVFVCRDCVDIRIDVFCKMEPQWGEEKIKHLEAIRVAK
jgi:hypothetical protein